MYTLEARCTLLDDFDGGRHGALQKVVNDQVFRTEGPSDGCKVHPAIQTAKPPTYWYQSTQRRSRKDTEVRSTHSFQGS